MNPVASVVLVLCAGAVLAVPQRWILAPLLAGSCYLGFGPGIELGPLSFTTIRLLIAAGMLRVIVRGELLPGGMVRLDRIMVLWAIWACVSCVFHIDPKGDLIEKLGNVYDALGLYLLLRSSCRSFDDVIRLCRITVLVLVPIAAGMLCEVTFRRNPFAILGNAPEGPMVRAGRFRAFGPFAQPIPAGTTGAVVLPLVVGLWRYSPQTAYLGGAACLSIIYCSGSSGPVMSAVAAIGALFLWRYRKHLRALRWACVAGYVVLDIVMKDPAYYIIARLDITGSSTGWHRAALIEASIKHFNEWWMGGTDYTRHWMPSGVSWSPNHTDITNHYLHMGVIGGLPLMLLFMAMLGTAFVYVGRSIRTVDMRHRFLLWAFGSALFSHAATCISVSYFDQSVVFLYLTLAVIASVANERVNHVSKIPRGSPRRVMSDVPVGPTRTQSAPSVRKASHGDGFLPGVVPCHGI